MKQRIRVVGLIRDGSDVLIMKRSQGRSDATPFWELPTGKIKFGEQPEEAISRAMSEYLGVEASNLDIHLLDVITFVATANSSQMSNLYIIYDIKIDKEAHLRAADRYSSYKYVDAVEAANYHLDEASATVLSIECQITTHSNYKEVANSATVFVDGASRGNPGPSGIGYYIVGEHGQVLAQGGEFIGFATARVAEYYALKKGILVAQELGLKSVRFVADSLMMINQMNGVYRIKNTDLIPIYDDIQALLTNFEACAFIHSPREQNSLADKQANLAIDQLMSAE